MDEKLPRGFTGQALKFDYKEDDDTDDLYFLPAYPRLKVKRFTAMDFSTLSAKMNAQVTLTIFYGKFVDMVVGEWRSNPEIDPIQKYTTVVQSIAEECCLMLNQNQTLNAKQPNTEIFHQKKKKILSFQFKSDGGLRIEADVFMTPFQILYQILSMKIKNIDLKISNKIYRIRFNFMKHDNPLNMVSYLYEGTYSDYSMAEALITVECANQPFPHKLKLKIQSDKPNRVENACRHTFFDDVIETSYLLIGEVMEQAMKRKPQKTPACFQFVHFTLPLYKYPVPTLSVIFLPIWILNLINMGIFFSNPGLSQRLSAVASLMIAYVALIPTVRAKIPPSSGLTFVEIQVFIQAFSSLFSIVQAITILNTPEYKFIWYQDPLFLLIMSLSIASVVSVVSLYVFHKLVWEPSYNLDVPDGQAAFLRRQWRNDACDRQFDNFRDYLTVLGDETYSPQSPVRMQSPIIPALKKKKSDLNKLIINRVQSQQNLQQPLIGRNSEYSLPDIDNT